MAFRLARSVLESHGLDEVPSPRGGAGVSAVRVDQVLLCGDEAPAVLAALARAGLDRVRARQAFACPGDAEALAESRALALRLGALVPRAGHGDPAVMHAERFAAPGRLAVCAGRVPACGAFGMLALERDALEVAEVLAGAPLAVDGLRVLGVELAGVPAPGTDGADLALAVLAGLAARGGPPDVIELAGESLARLGIRDRVAACWLLADAGCPALMPSDERTRGELRALGRDEDWRGLEAATEPGEATPWSIDLAALAPMIAPAEDLARARPARPGDWSGVERVVVGPGATLHDLEALAARCGVPEAGALPGAALAVVPGSRSLHDAALASGLAARLAALGATIGESAQAVLAGSAGGGLAYGVPLEALRQSRGPWHVAGLAGCAAAVRGARPEPAGAEALPEVPARAVAPDAWLTPEPAPGDAAPAARPAPGRRAGRLASDPLRGEVLAVLGDDVASADLLPSGARVEGLRGSLRALAGQVLAGLDPGFAARARERGGGFLVAGEGFARGGPRAAALLCLAELGVVAVLARSFAPGAARALVRAGVLPLSLSGPAEDGRLRAGDVLELPGPLAVAHAPRTLAARDLTRGAHVVLGSALPERDVEVVRAGGALAHLLGAARGR